MNAQEKHPLNKTLLCLLLATGALACTAAQAQDAGETEVRTAMKADPDNAIRTLKAGDQAQRRRFDAGVEELEPRTRALVRGETPEAQALRERGNDARHVRNDVRQRQVFEDLERSQPARTGPRADVERLGHHPDELDRMQRAGEATRARRGYPERNVVELSNGRAPEAAELHRRGEISRTTRAPRAAATHVDLDAPRASSGKVRAGKVAGGVAGGMVAGAAAGWAIETATGVHTPDPLEAAKWTGDTLQRPQDMPQRLGELGKGGVRMAGQFATALTRPDRMAVNVGRGAVSLAETGAYMVTHPAYTARTVVNTGVAIGKTTANIGVGLGKGVYTVGKVGVNAVTHPARTVHSVGKGIVKAGNGAVKAVNKFGCGIDRLFKPKKRC